MLSRFAFSFMILAGLLLYEVYREITPVGASPPLWRIVLYCLGAGISVGLAVMGLRERHRSDKSQ